MAVFTVGCLDDYYENGQCRNVWENVRPDSARYTCELNL